MRKYFQIHYNDFRKRIERLSEEKSEKEKNLSEINKKFSDIKKSLNDEQKKYLNLNQKISELQKEKSSLKENINSFESKVIFSGDINTEAEAYDIVISINSMYALSKEGWKKITLIRKNQLKNYVRVLFVKI